MLLQPVDVIVGIGIGNLLILEGFFNGGVVVFS